MATQMFRKVALERLSSPEQLDQLLQVTSPKAWIALIALGGVLLAAVLWGILGTVSTTVEGQGVLIRPEGVKSVVASRTGVVSNVLVRPGDVVYKEREIVQVAEPRGGGGSDVAFLVSNYSGRVLEVLVSEGSTVEKGTVLVTLEPLDDRLEALIYVPAAEGQRIRPGMKVEISPSTVKWSEFGYLVGEVEEAAKFPSTHEGMMRSLENAELVRSLASAGPCVRVTARLTPDANTPSGYRWSSSRGPELAMHHGTPCRVRITVRAQRPVSLLIPKIRDLLGF